jgi:tRNA-specific 2-thiouridylase
VRGHHTGIANFTIGQRRGLGLAGEQPRYVVDLDPDTNTVTVGAAADLESDRLMATGVNIIAGEIPRDAIRVEARIRHRHIPASATVTVAEDRTALVVFDEPQRAITPGQSVVWYQGDLVIGGGVIAR